MPDISLRAVALLTANALRNIARDLRELKLPLTCELMVNHAKELERAALADAEKEKAELDPKGDTHLSSPAASKEIKCS